MWKARLSELSTASRSDVVVPPSPHVSLRELLSSDSFKLVPMLYPHQRKLNFTIENLSGLAVGIGILVGGTSVGPCSGDQVSGLPSVFPAGSTGVGGFVMWEVSQNPNLLTFLPIGGKVSGINELGPCDGSMFSGLDFIPITVTTVLAVPGKGVVTLPLSSSVQNRPN